VSLREDDILAGLNAAQQAAVQHIDGPLLVLAGPGSGKTRVITRRAANIVRCGVRPWNVLAVTFTNKAADEMKRRIEALGVGRGMAVMTFHALGVRLLRELGTLVGVRAGFSIYDDDDQARMFKEAIRFCKLDDKMLRIERVRHAISAAKNQLQEPQEYAERADYFDQRAIARVYAVYTELLRKNNAVDFDDLLMLPALLLQRRPEVTQQLNERFRYVLIDEYQDTNHAQYVLAQLLAKHHRNLCVTGDPDQSIYAWRGADIRNILDFEEDFPEATTVRLEQNYRSTPAILRVASQIIRNNKRRKHKDLWTENADGEPVFVWDFETGDAEAEHIAETIAEMARENRRYSDIAIFYRINALSRGLEESLRARGIPYRIARGVEFYSRREIRDTLAYLRLLVNAADDIALRRIINTPARGIGDRTVARIADAAAHAGLPMLEFLLTRPGAAGLSAAAEKKVAGFVELMAELRAAAAETPLAELTSLVVERSGLEDDLRGEAAEGGDDRLANIAELVTAAARYEEETEEPSLEGFLQRISLASDQDAVDEAAGVVMLMTLHAAKGLEFPVVFLAGMEDGLLPHERSINDKEGIEEERRLLFVGVTRAEKRLYLTRADTRVIRGALMARTASRFVYEIPDDASVSESFRDRSRDRRLEAWGAQTQPSPEEDWAGRRSRNLRRMEEAEPVYSVNDPTIGPRVAPERSPFADWAAGTLLQHTRYGVGQIVWIQPGGSWTRAGVRFAAYGEKTLILEKAPVQRLGKGGQR